VNRGALKLTQVVVGEFWKGPIVVVRRMCYGDGTDGESDDVLPGNGTTIIKEGAMNEVEGVTLADLRHAVDLFLNLPGIEGGR
jgi:hypothetical protein